MNTATTTVMSQLQQLVTSYLSRSAGYQWLAFLPLALCILGLSCVQQYQLQSEKKAQVTQQLATQQRKNIVVNNRLKAMQKNSLPQSLILSNDQIADKLQHWINQSNTEMVTLVFSEESYDSQLRITQIKGDFLLNARALFQFLNKELGDSLFIDSLSLRGYDSERMKMHVQLLQPKPEAR